MADIRNPGQPPALHFSLPPARRTLPVVQGHDCVVALKALGEDTRVRIVGILLDEALEVGEIARRLGVSQYNVSKHLRILREAGLLRVEKAGRRHLYALPEEIRRGASEGRILDLGCCSFQFDGAQPASATPGTRRRAVRPRARAPR
jgi:DNA-binding transcriptional ArsR family regulator